MYAMAKDKQVRLDPSFSWHREGPPFDLRMRLISPHWLPSVISRKRRGKRWSPVPDDDEDKEEDEWDEEQEVVRLLETTRALGEDSIVDAEADVDVDIDASNFKLVLLWTY